MNASLQSLQARAAQDLEEARAWRRFAWDALQRAQQTRKAVDLELRDLVNNREFCLRYRNRILDHLLDAAMSATRVTMGNIQLKDPLSGSLVIHTHRGFAPSFLEFFSHVDSGHAACGTALRTGARQIVVDVAQSEIFRDNRTLEILLDANVRAVQSTPLVGSQRQVVGVLSTHYPAPHQPTPRELETLDRFAQRARSIIEWYHSLNGAPAPA